HPEYAVSTLKAAEEGGADIVVLCDTNGGTLPYQVGEIVAEIARHIDIPVGIHAHNDCELGVANAMDAVQSGCSHVQGTVNGYGKRCGNTNLCSLIPNLQIKQNYECIPDEKLIELTSLSRFVSELANLT